MPELKSNESPRAMPAANPIILIPTRMQAARLPGKPLAEINGVAMIVHVLNRAQESGIGRVVVAAQDPEIIDVVKAHNGEAVLTGAQHRSGSDRIYEALQILDPGGKHDLVVNLQGDLPTLEPRLIGDLLAPFAVNPEIDITTLVTEISHDSERTDPNIVKAVVGFAESQKTARALYFTRAIAPAGAGPHYHHIGIYGYRRESLARFVALAPSVLEKRERLEQLRALEAGMHIEAVRVDTMPLGVDTPEDLKRAARLLAARPKL